MRVTTGILFFIGSLCWKYSLQYQMHLTQEDEYNFCMNRDHYILKPTATCCGKTVIRPGINIEQHWKACAIPGGNAEDIMASSWRIYVCILKKISGGGDSITLSKFAELMTINYTEPWKQSIMAVVAAITKTAAYENKAALNSLRVTYFDVEQKICSNGTNIISDSTPVRPCLFWEEENHRGGRCCSNESFPLDIEMKSYFELPSPVQLEECQEKLAYLNNIFSKLPKVTRDNIVVICDFSCYLQTKGIVQIPQMFALTSTKDIEAFANKMYPDWVSSSVKKSGSAFVVRNVDYDIPKQSMMDYEFPGNFQINSTDELDLNHFYVLNTTNITTGTKGHTLSEYRRGKFSNNEILAFPTVCALHKEILRLAQFSLYNMVRSSFE